MELIVRLKLWLMIYRVYYQEQSFKESQNGIWELMLSQFAIETSLLSALNCYFLLFVLPLIKVSLHYSRGFHKSAVYKI